jgi:hypothetical protein
LDNLRAALDAFYQDAKASSSSPGASKERTKAQDFMPKRKKVESEQWHNGSPKKRENVPEQEEQERKRRIRNEATRRNQDPCESAVSRFSAIHDGQMRGR